MKAAKVKMMTTESSPRLTKDDERDIAYSACFKTLSSARQQPQL